MERPSANTALVVKARVMHVFKEVGVARGLDESPATAAFAKRRIELGEASDVVIRVSGCFRFRAPRYGYEHLAISRLKSPAFPLIHRQFREGAQSLSKEAKLTVRERVRHSSILPRSRRTNGAIAFGRVRISVHEGYWCVAAWDVFEPQTIGPAPVSARQSRTARCVSANTCSSGAARPRQEGCGMRKTTD